MPSGKGFKEFIKFGLVGLSNVFVSYGLYLLFLFFFEKAGIFSESDYIISQVLSYILSIFWSFYWNRKFVFKAKDVPVIPALIRTFLSYSFTGLFLNSVLLYLWVDIFGISKVIAPIINVVINVPINFLLNKFWAFKK